MNRLWLLSGECRWINNNPRLNHPLIYSKPFVCFPSALGRKQVLRIERGIARSILYQETLPLDDRRRCYKVLGICYATSLLYEFTTTSGFLEREKEKCRPREKTLHASVNREEKVFDGPSKWQASGSNSVRAMSGRRIGVQKTFRRDESETQNYFYNAIALRNIRNNSLVLHCFIWIFSKMRLF